MNTKHWKIFRTVIIGGILLLLTGALSISPAQSADTFSPNANPILTLSKTVVKDNGGTATEANFQAYIDEDAVDWDIGYDDRTTGTYTVSEVADIPGYQPSIWSGDCEPDGTINMVAEDTSYACSITNNDIPPSLTLTKLVIKDDGGTAVPTNWTLTATGPTTISGPGGAVSGSNFVAGTYTLSESAGPPGYTSGSWSCTGDGVQVDNEITLAINETATCTITSDDIAPTLKLVKTVNNSGVGPGVADDWTLAADAPSPNDGRNFFNAGGSGSFTTVFANAGYTLSESSLKWTDGVEYNAGTWSCDGGSLVGSVITLSEGQTGVTCTITNDYNAPSLTVVKNPINDKFTAAPDDFLLTVGGGLVSSGVAYNYTHGVPLAINETQLPGYRFVSITGDLIKCPLTLGGTITMAPGDDITCTITNNDIGVNITPTSGLLTDESGFLTDTFEVVLDAEPTAEVTLPLSSSDPFEGTIDQSSLIFTPLNWFQPQTVTVTGVDDFIADGPQPYTIVTGPISSDDLDYAGLDPVLDIPDVSVTNADNETPGISTSPSTDLWTSEGGATEKVQVLLQSQPSSPVLLNIVSSDPGEGTVSPSSLTFNPEPGLPVSPKEFTITGIDDCNKDGNTPYTVSITAVSDDLDYNGTSIDLQVTNYEAPTISWVEPVEDGEIYLTDGFSPIKLKVINKCGEPISKVRFYRWVTALGDHVTIGEDLNPPYEETILPSELESGWNQIFAFAFGPPNSRQTFSIHETILILKDANNLVHLPLINKQP